MIICKDFGRLKFSHWTKRLSKESNLCGWTTEPSTSQRLWCRWTAERSLWIISSGWGGKKPTWNMEMRKEVRTGSPFLILSTMWWKWATPKNRGLTIIAWKQMSLSACVSLSKFRPTVSVTSISPACACSAWAAWEACRRERWTPPRRERQRGSATTSNPLLSASSRKKSSTSTYASKLRLRSKSRFPTPRGRAWRRARGRGRRWGREGGPGRGQGRGFGGRSPPPANTCPRVLRLQRSARRLERWGSWRRQRWTSSWSCRHDLDLCSTSKHTNLPHRKAQEEMVLQLQARGLKTWTQPNQLLPRSSNHPPPSQAWSSLSTIAGLEVLQIFNRSPYLQQSNKISLVYQRVGQHFDQYHLTNTW